MVLIRGTVYRQTIDGPGKLTRNKTQARECRALTKAGPASYNGRGTSVPAIAESNRTTGWAMRSIPVAA